MQVCYFGTYTMEEGYPRNRVIIEGLRKNGVEVIECHEELWKGTSEKLEGIKDGFAIFKQSARILRTYLKLINKYRRVGKYDALIVGYAGHVDIFLAKLLNLFRKKPLIFDAFLSLYDTAVMDREIVAQSSLKARLLWRVDRWACRMADAVLLDTQAHVDYFVREFRLPAEKFHAIPVGSFIKVHEEPHPHLNPLPEGEEISLRVTKERENFPPLQGEGQGGDELISDEPLMSPERTKADENTLPFKGRDRVGMGVFSDEHQKAWKGRFSVLYFGSYIPLHGVDVILQAAKVVQDEFPPPLSPLPRGEGRCEGAPVIPPPLMGGGEGEGERRLYSDESKVVFTLVGTGQLLSEMKELASRLELKNIIFIDRFVSEEELVGYIQEADICLGIFGQTEKASRVIPCKVYNCLAMGKPLITAATQATEGVLTDKENAILCRPGDAEDLAQAILILKNDVILRSKIARRGREYFMNNFSSKAIGKKVKDLIYRTSEA